MNKLQSFLASHSINTHTAAVFMTAIIAGYYAVPSFHDLVNQAEAHLPKVVLAAAVALWQLYSWYRVGKATGVVGQVSKALPLLVFAITLPLMLTGCPSGKYGKAAAAVDDLSIAVKTIQDVEIAAHHGSLVTDQEDVVFQKDLIIVSDAGNAVVASVKNFKDKKGVQASVDAALTSVNQLSQEGVIGIKNEKSRAEIEAAVLSLKVLLATIDVALQ